jgi:hypothetical protein
MFKFLQAALSDGTDPSSTRIIVTGSMALLIPALVGVWSYLSITHGVMQPIDTSIIGFITMLGVWHVSNKVSEK